MSRRRAGLAAGLAGLAALALAAGCADRGPRAAAPPPPPFADCAALSPPPRLVLSPTSAGGALSAASPGAPSAAPGSTGGAGAARAGERGLPALALPCLTGGAAVATGALAGPLVVNLWATWCPPCRAELPVFQRFADRTPGVRVLGVVTSDNPDWAGDLGRDLGVRFPQLVDRTGALQRALGAVGLPATVLLPADGRPRYLHQAPLTEATLASLAATHLGARP
ncbi:hypothetical protein GCM10010124_00400 [Pilimelia terevasa]|uniref:Thioredoxin domain-containing protein n=1 Tax=Pilimelia terevasa TaxID=53372 RepID=A0A8J3BCP6_9ACTN|nr:TlpA disulfide reductase family protein [Pilimelia terevasa]GGK11682.1 hypothetical protein GCM10010124_00400 [Pilimelia terevasa]